MLGHPSSGPAAANEKLVGLRLGRMRGFRRGLRKELSHLKRLWC